jgi:hypothetical protein
MKEFLNKIGNGEIRSILAVISILGSFALMFTFIFAEIPKENRDVVMMGAGSILTGTLGGVIGYYFGASKGNETKINKV